MSNVINVKKGDYCATCKYYGGNCIKNYDPKSGNMTVDNSGSKCTYHKRGVLATNHACSDYNVNPLI